MLDLFSHLWIWLLSSLGVGAAVGYLVKRPEKENGVAAWLVWAGLAFLAGLVAALLGVFAGRAGVWLETALAAFAAFLGGSALGTLGRGGSLREHEGWALGLVPAGLLWWGANLFGVPDFEAALKQKVASTIERLGGNVAGVSVSGRDVTISRSATDAPGLGVAVNNLDGVRYVATIEAAAAPPQETAKSDVISVETDTDKDKKTAAQAPGGWADPSKRPAGKTVAAKSSHGAESARSGTAHPEARSNAPAVDGAAPKIDKKKAAEILAALPASGELDAASCHSALSAAVTLEKIQFRIASVSIRLASAQILDKLVALLQRCPKAHVEVGGYTDNVGDDEDNDALSQRRADAVVKYLEREGVARGRLTGVGYGSKKPIASNDDEDGRAENRRIEFTVK